jgi:hypothetical protein
MWLWSIEALDRVSSLVYVWRSSKLDGTITPILLMRRVFLRKLKPKMVPRLRGSPDLSDVDG